MGQHSHQTSEERRRYWVWAAMIQRCTNPRNPEYVNYGGRGIYVCERWRKSSAAFITDMGARPSPTHTLERINNDGPYSPENCKWVPRLTNNMNKRTYRNSPIGLRCIAPRKDHAGYRVRIRRGGRIVFDKTCKSLDLAVQARDSFLAGGSLCA